MDKGRVVAQGPIERLKQSRGQVFELRVKDSSGVAFIDVLRGEGLECHLADDAVMRVLVPGDEGARRIFALASAAHVQVRHLRPSVQTLDDVFAHAVGEE
jgi:ABC-type uncharacterized transport system ATPase subunit